MPRLSKNTFVLLLPSSAKVSLVVLNHPLLVERNLITTYAKFPRMCTCHVVYGGVAGGKPTADVNSIKTLKVQSRDNNITSLCLFVIFQTYSQV